MKIKDVLKTFKNLGCQKILIKRLSPNDNSKNQIYIGGEKAIEYLPFTKSELAEQTSKKKKASKYIFRNKLNFSWVTSEGTFTVPDAKVIFYPQYPESRFSGFLKGCKNAPSNIIGPRLEDRFLILTHNTKSESFGYVNFIDKDFISFLKNNFEEIDEHVFFEARIETLLSTKKRKNSLKNSIGEISSAIKGICDKGWIQSKRLLKDGSLEIYNAPNGGGVTLESELGIFANSDAKPDYKGWELKQHSGRPVTLFTPEPDSGFYNEQGIAEFIKKYGYPDKNGKKDRFNFGGIHRISNEPHHLTKLRLIISGFKNGNFTSKNGFIGLESKSGDIVAKWTFPKLLIHWQRKHAKTCFVKSERKEENGNYYYKYSTEIELGIESSFLKFLDSLEKGITYYDPASKLFKEQNKWKTKARSQFRIKESDLRSLYKEYLKIDVKN